MSGVKVFKTKLRKGDLVKVIRGRHKGQTGRILAVRPRLNQVMVENVNLSKKHFKPNKEYPQGAIAEVHQPLAASKVAIVEPESQKASKIGWLL